MYELPWDWVDRTQLDCVYQILQVKGINHRLCILENEVFFHCGPQELDY